MQYLNSFVLVYMLVVLTGIPDLVYALSCNDKVPGQSFTYADGLTSFVEHSGKTYAISTGVGAAGQFFAGNPNISLAYRHSSNDAGSLKQRVRDGYYGAARVPFLDSQATLDWIRSSYNSSQFYIDAWKEYGQQTFTTMSGGGLPFTDWGTAPGTLPDTPMAVAIIGGKMEYGQTSVTAAQIWEFSGVLDCAIPESLWDYDPGTGGTGDTGGTSGTGTVDPRLQDDTIKVCAVDHNNDGAVDAAGEMQNCAVTQDGAICPIDATQCTALNLEPICPEGTTLNPDRDMCQVDPEVKCPVGYTWDRSIDQCVMDVVCPEGGLLNPTTDRCEKVVQNDCPATYQYDSARDICFKTVTCPDTGAYNPNRDRCEAPLKFVCDTGYTYNVTAKICEIPPVCPAGSAYNTSRDRCERAPSPCPAGYTHNPVLDKCVASPLCPTGGVLNASTDRCEVQAATQCQSGWTYNSGTSKCEKAPVCTSPGAFNSAYDLCMASSTGTICPSGYSYSSVYGACIQAPSCPGGGTYSSYNKRCEMTPTKYCSDPTFTYNATRDRCEKPPVCPSGYSYSTTYNKCVQAATKSCPSGYYLNASRNRCEKTPECPTGTVYNATMNRCEGQPSCTSGTYNTSTNTCSSSSSYGATCPSGYSFISGTCCNSSGSCSYCSTGTCYVATTAQVTGGFSMTTPLTISTGSDSPALFIGYISSSPVAGGDVLYNYWTSDGGCASNYIISEFYSPPDCRLGYAPNAPASGLVRYTDSVDGVLIADFYVAPSPGTYGGTQTCPSGAFLNSGTCYLVGNLQCPSGGTLTGTTCNTTTQSGAICPSGTWLDGNVDKCINANPTCIGGSFDPTNDVCYIPYTPVCAYGSTYDSSIAMCVVNPTCSGGALDTTYDVCYTAYTTSCASGYYQSGSVCVAAPTCGSGGSFNSSIGYCSAAATFTCPTGYTYSGTYGQCYRTPDCGSGSLNASLDICQMAYTLNCGTGYTLSGSTCIAVPTCMTGGTFSGVIDLCQSGITCPDAFQYDSTVDICQQPSTCPTGSTLNIVADKCHKAAQPDCTYPSGRYSYDGTNGVCAIFNSECAPAGSWAEAAQRCQVVVTKNCGTYTLITGTQTCKQDIVCPTDANYSLRASIAYSTSLNVCTSDTEHTCTVLGTTYMGVPETKCEAVPICDGMGVYDPEASGCFAGNSVCPHGDFPCVEWNDKMMCSPHQCVALNSNDPGNETVPEPKSLTDDGSYDEDGNCVGQLYIFGGKASRCRPPGWTVGYINNCCTSDTVLPESTNTGITMLGSISQIADMAKAAYWTYQGFQAGKGVMALGGSATDALDLATTVVDNAVDAGKLGADAASSYLGGASAATQGGSIGSAVTNAAVNAGSALLVGAASFAVTKLVKTMGGDQDSVAIGQLAMAAGLLSGPQAAIGIVVIVVMRVLMGTGCDANDITTSMYEKSKRCHFVGDYCEKKILGMCAQSAKGYCCFNSILARVIHEQGRPQLKVFASDVWGPAKQPNCRGFTPDEFQAIDFSKVDMSEYIDVVTNDMAGKIQGATTTMTNKIQDRMQQLYNH